ncbi:hydroxymethylglutaryl-CoA lyase, mitochondrial [Athalia rosae]|uniref:hydroxymethylglutaryl-CoA lyase, mitochondrial n=1 Tax=Athalia rosae TaxID=37344 RepID=UPI0020340FE0|nr:hydroxymethylglutaryl-CoA lyase, mitochondrial [Athalia rosae]XP_020709474.2 hydroxymethylglutaryl-CoA lyase, mitochondrial [Athalia rosae]
MFRFLKNYILVRSFSNSVRIVEVGPRDGLQNESLIVPTATKINFINKLSETGLKTIEVTSFVSPKWIPQMADNEEVFKSIDIKPEISYPVLVPNLQGFEKALSAGVKEIAIFGAASEAFSRKNINCSIAKSIERFSLVTEQARRKDVKIRGYISCIAGCPYEGETKPLVVANLAASMLDLGCYEISLGDTIGVGTPKKIKALLNELQKVSSSDKIFEQYALHCHDTFGQALTNIYASLDFGIRIFDSSVAGLGGCPYAAGASGNVATEDLLYFLNGQGLESGVDLKKVIDVGDYISTQIGRVNRSKVGVAVLAKEKLNKVKS